jgi:hypothetical protein
MGASRIIGVLVVASEAVDAGTPVDAGQVVDAVGKGQELVFIVCCTVVVAVAVSVDFTGAGVIGPGATYSKNWQYQ